MTIFRYDKVRIADLQFQRTSSNEPDLISVEVLLDGNGLFSVDMDPQGQVVILFDEIENAEFPLPDLLEVFERCRKELEHWREGLVQPGGIWEAFRNNQ
jgi:hypothetical protein